MARQDSWLDEDTLLDVSVNLVPIAILLFFVVLFAVVTPWPPNLLLFAVGHALTVIPLVFLALLTAVAASVFERSESDLGVRGPTGGSSEDGREGS